MRTPLILLLAIALASGNTSAETRVHLGFGIVPQQAPSKLAAAWVPVLEYLSTKSELKIDFMTAPDIPTFEQRLSKGEYDIAYMNPHHYTVFHDSVGYNAFARQKNERIVGLIVVNAASSITDITQLSGTTIAFPAPGSFAASLLPIANLKREGIDFKSQFVASHDSVYETVARGLYPAGGGIERTLANAPPDTRQKLRVLWRTNQFSPHAFASHPRVAQSVLDKLRAALLAMELDPAAQPFLATLKFSGFESAIDADWNDIRALNIKENDLN